MRTKVTTGPYPYPVHVHMMDGLLGHVTHCLTTEDATALYEELGRVLDSIADRGAQ